MPYRSRYSRRRRTTRRAPRRTTFRPRTLRRTRPSYRRRRPMMSRRRILNVTSQKKQDNMTQFVPTDPINSPGGTGVFGDQIITAGSGTACFLFCPSARQFQTTQNDESDRNSKNTYARGYKEITTLKVSGGTPWRRRRIVFSMKGLPEYLLTQISTFTANYYRLQTSAGYVRQSAVLAAANVGVVNTVVFQGALGSDWSFQMNAKTDSTRITVLSDSVININPGNASGSVRTVKQWYPLNKNLVYGDDESGAGTASSDFSTLAKPGMGDVFIFDIYESALVNTDQLSVNNQGTYYWHEK